MRPHFQQPNLPSHSSFNAACQPHPPYYYERVNFAALSLNGIGPASYGDCHFSFKPQAVAHRTTVFEENTLVFTAKENVRAGARPPAGFLATWEKRGCLAVAKLASKLSKDTDPAEFQTILLVNRGSTDTDEFLECHVFGRLTISNIEEMKATKPKSAEDELIAERASRKLIEAGISVSDLNLR